MRAGGFYENCIQAVLFLKVSEFRDFLLETDVNVLETDAFLLVQRAFLTGDKDSELVTKDFELKKFSAEKVTPQNASPGA